LNINKFHFAKLGGQRYKIICLAQYLSIIFLAVGSLAVNFDYDFDINFDFDFDPPTIAFCLLPVFPLSKKMYFCKLYK